MSPILPILWVTLSELLLQEGRDLDAAEKALRKLLELDPAHAEARKQLAAVTQQRGREAAGGVGAQGVTLTQFYHAVCTVPSDINEHSPKLCALARECRQVTELGTRAGNSTIALLYAQPGKMVCYGAARFPHEEFLRRLAGKTEIVFVQGDVLQVDRADRPVVHRHPARL